MTVLVVTLLAQVVALRQVQELLVLVSVGTVAGLVVVATEVSQQMVVTELVAQAHLRLDQKQDLAQVLLIVIDLVLL